MPYQYSCVTQDDLSDNRVLFADGKNPSGRMVHTSTVIYWLASGKKGGEWTVPNAFEEPKKEGFTYHDPKER